MIDRSSSLSHILKSTLKGERASTSNRCRLAKRAIVYLGSLQFNGRPSSPMYCRTCFGSFFVLTQDERGTSLGKTMASRLTRSARVHASFSSFHDCRFVIQAYIPYAAPSSYACKLQVSGERDWPFYLSSASRSCFVRAYSLTCFVWREGVLRETRLLIVSHSFVGVLLIQFVDALGDFVICLTFNRCKHFVFTQFR